MFIIIFFEINIMEVNKTVIDLCFFFQTLFTGTENIDWSSEGL